jgi:hypothetical protein
MTKLNQPKKSVPANFATCVAPARKRPGRKPAPIVEFPEPLATEWTDPSSFPEAFSLQLARHGDSCWHLHNAIVRRGEKFDRKTFQVWATGQKLPHSITSFEILARVERRYRLPEGYFRAKIANTGRAPFGLVLPKMTIAERRRIAWHLPDDFDRRPPAEQAEIIGWVRTVIISGSTDYRRFQAEAMTVRYSIRFPAELRDRGEGIRSRPSDAPSDGGPVAPDTLVDEMRDLVRFKTTTLTEIGDKRNGVWGSETVVQKVEHVALMFGAIVGRKGPPLEGFGAPVGILTLALLAFPTVWDWYLQWREARRGFYTSWELNMLSFGLALTRRQTGWLRQRPALVGRLQPIDGLVSQSAIDAARGDWDRACDAAHEHGLSRFKEIQRVARVHRDPFEAILPILEDESPVAAYRRITAEILRMMPDMKRYPRPAAEAIRSFLMLRLGLHLGVRQKNLRQLMLCPRGAAPRSERQLELLGRGELRWNVRESGWEVIIPAKAFKNATSSFFGKQAFRLMLPDLDGLYGHIDAFIHRHRPLLLAGAEDPGTFFVKTVKRNTADASYNQTTFYEAWRLIIQRHGIYNPYTGNGVIKGLLPHGPHNVRDVLATHVLKRTGSYEQASYAIQDTPEMVRQHYGRFLPQDKAALAARVLNEVWSDG